MFTLFCPDTSKLEDWLPLQPGFVILFFYCYVCTYAANKGDCL